MFMCTCTTCVYSNRRKINIQKPEKRKEKKSTSFKFLYYLLGTEIRAQHTKNRLFFLRQIFSFIIIFHFFHFSFLALSARPGQHGRCRDRILVYCYIILRSQFLSHLISGRVESLCISLCIQAVCVCMSECKCERIIICDILKVIVTAQHKRFYYALTAYIILWTCHNNNLHFCWGVEVHAQN